MPLIAILFCSYPTGQNESNIEDDKINNDYFPLKIGNTWIYQFDLYREEHFLNEFTKENGIATIKILSKMKEEYKTKYCLSLDKRGERIVKHVNYTTFVASFDTSLFARRDSILFIEDINNIVEGVEINEFFHFQLPMYSEENADTLSLGTEYPGPFYKIVKDVGIVHHIDGDFSNSGHWEEEWLLSSYHLK